MKPFRQKFYKLGELFCGPGGLALGAELAQLRLEKTIYGFQQVWASDYDADTCETFRRNIAFVPSGKVICEDVRKLNIRSLGKIDGFSYGFPCNDFSIVGERKGFSGNFGPLYDYGVKVLNYHKPKFFLAENVGGIGSANEGRTFQKILNDLQNAGRGYNLTVHLYKAEEYSVPQTRHRYIIVGIEKRLKRIFKVPVPTSSRQFVSSREALEVPPIAAIAANHETTKQAALVVERLILIKPGQNVWNASLPKRLQINAGGAKLSQIYKRLHPDQPSYTITGSGGGGTHGYHYFEPRALTNRERARLQTFPDNFIFYGSKESVRKQIGMAVPVLLSKVIFESILKTLHGIDYPSIRENFTAR